MTTPNAQAQARWRAKRDAELQALRNSPNLGPDIMLAPAEVSYLLPLLMALRNEASKAEPAQKPKPAPDPKVLRKSQDAKEKRRQTIQHRQALRKADGDYFVIRTEVFGAFGSAQCRHWVEQVKVGTQGRHQQTMLSGFSFWIDTKFNSKLDRWEVSGSYLYGTWEEAAIAGRQRAANGDDVSGLDPVLGRADKDELRRIRARNHPDHHADADTALYQSAIQALDALRNVNH
jgi:hypothetical protein